MLVLKGLVDIAPYSSSVKNASNTHKKSNLSYVLVNEDTGVEFNGQNYNLGKNFVTLISQDTQEN